MDNFVFNIIKRLGIFTIIAQTMIHFCPNTQYEKYIKVLIGIMSITIVITPFLGVLKDFTQNDFTAAIELWQEKIVSSGGESGMDFTGNPLDSIVTIDDSTMVNNKIDIAQEELNEEIKSRINNATKEEDYMVTDVTITVDDYEKEKIIIKLIERKEGIVIIDDITIKKDEVTEKEYEKWKNICATCLGIDEHYLEVVFL